jgi:two-component system, LytTR family, response regulator
MKAFIIDDEPHARLTLKTYLSKYCSDILIVGEADNLMDAANGIQSSSPELVFLDINLGGESGLTLFEHIRPVSFFTIFTTAHSEFAVQAFKHDDAAYLLKPLLIEDLIHSVSRAQKRVQKRKVAADHDAMKELLKRVNIVEKLPLPILDGQILVHISDIVHCEADNCYTIFHFMSRGKIVVCRTLGHYEQALKDKGFVRVHNHHLINLSHVTRYQRGRGGIIHMADGSEIDVSQRKKDDFLQALDSYYPSN